MKVLVLGGTRFIGLGLVRYLDSLKHDITILNRGKSQADLPAGIKRVYADRRDSEAVKKALSGQQFDVIFDMTGYDVKNVEPVVELFSGKIKQYIFQSTTAVYAEPRFVPMMEDAARLSKQNPGKGAEAAYGLGKAECEDYLLNKYKENRFPATILRCPAIYGPDNWMHEREFSYFIRLLQGRKILLPGNGLGLMQFTYVHDVARAAVEAVGKKDAVGQAFNIAMAGAVTSEGYVDIIAEMLGVKAGKVYLDYSVMESLKQPVYPFLWNSNAFLSIYKAKDVFGFWPEFDIAKGLKATYQWWEKNVGVDKTRLEPGKMGYNVSFAFEDELIKKYGAH
jgi:nucleoside-diphosphate-sugar epimerase